MVGSRLAVVGAVTAALSFASERALACVIPPPPVGLTGLPAHGDRDVPTDVVLVYASLDANLYEEAEIERATFELTSSSGTTIGLTPEMRYAWHFELVPRIWLEPSTEYTLRATLPSELTLEPSIPVSLSFTTGEGPLTVPPQAPYPRMQHYHSTDTVVSSCDPGAQGSCIFFEPETPGAGIEITYWDAPDVHYLTFGSWWTDLTSTDQGSLYPCATFKTRAADGTSSGPIDICREEAETFTVPDLTGLDCTETGFKINGVPLTGSGGNGATGGAESGGTGTGSRATGGVGTAGSGNSAGTPDEPDDDGSRTVMTEGCGGCRVPGPRRGALPAGFLAVAVSFLLLGRRRA